MISFAYPAVAVFHRTHPGARPKRDLIAATNAVKVPNRSWSSPS
ncbi:MAG: hypothetical protein ACRENL_11110 [Candidatus Dormibacteria bacterium]